MKRVLLIIGGGIAAYKTPELVRQLRAHNLAVRCLLTAAGAQFVSSLSLASVSGDKVYENLFDLNDEAEMGHIQLSRNADMILVAPATANLIAKMAHGLADDLAGTTLLATDKPVMIAPAMNVRMWEHTATKRNIERLGADGVDIIGPDEGDMACGEFGFGRMCEPAAIAGCVAAKCNPKKETPLAGKKILITAGPTHEAIDPVRYIANRSSGKQGYAIAEACAGLGGDVTLISGPTALPAPSDLTTIRVESARDMHHAVQQNLPTHIAILTAAVADWHVKYSAPEKLKKQNQAPPPQLELIENPDILAWLCNDATPRPDMIIGFAAETENVLDYARQKRERKKCDWIIANDVSPAFNVMGGDMNKIHIIGKDICESWDRASKQSVGEKLAQFIAHQFNAQEKTHAASH